MYFAYIDPGTGSMLISATIALFSVGFFMLKGLIYRKFNIGGEKGQFVDPNYQHGIVFYSEGKQYWNVFKPLLEECSNRNIEVTFMTSDKEDPALKANIPGINTFFIGSGREGYFVLNRLKALIVVMTTPGLDVLEIKRSKYVQHYSHITHAPGCVAGYKSYALDYFDSVLLGGTGDVEVIRYFENLRNLPKKDIEIIGHTYLDEYRKILAEKNYKYTMFDNKRTTVLVSPTWSNHGLLMKYGEKILTKLVESDKYNIIIRPHPQSLLTEKDMISNLMNQFPNGKHLVWDTQVENLKSMAHADIMISDFSGIVFDFFTLFNKPILTMRSQYEKRGRDVIDMPNDPWDIQMLGKIGATLNEEDIESLPELIQNTMNHYGTENAVDQETIFTIDRFPGESSVRGVNFIQNKYQTLQTLEEKSGIKEIQSFTGYISDSKNSWIKNFFYGILQLPMLYQISISSLLLILYILIGLSIFPSQGLNYEFFSRLLPLAMILSLGLICITALISRFFSKGILSFNKEKEAFEILDLFLVLIPLTPIIIYIFANQDILDMVSSIRVFGTFYLISTFIVVILPWILSPLLSKNLTSSIGIALLFTAFNMASFGRTTNMKFISLILVSIAAISFIIQYGKRKSILVVMSVLLFTVNMFTAYSDSVQKNNPNEEKPIINSDSKLSALTQNLIPVNFPDVYILIYDSYENQETLESYGFDNSSQIDYLLEDGFTIYDGSYTLLASSLASMSHMLHAEKINPTTNDYREHIASKSAGVNIFKKMGYTVQSVQNSDYMTRGFTPEYNFSFPDDMNSIKPDSIIRDAIIEGEFRFDVEFSSISQNDYLNAKEFVLTKTRKEPQFLYTHTKFPGHSQNSGVLLPNEKELHFEKLDIANLEMRKDIENIRNKNRDAIIVVAGDHGPYLTKNGIGLGGHYDTTEVNQLDIQDRFGTFLAISWPEETFAASQDIRIVQDIIPAVMSYIYDDHSLFENTRMDRTLMTPYVTAGATVSEGIIQGGEDDGKPLFDIVGQRSR